MNSLHDVEVRLDLLMPLIREKLDAGLSVQFSPQGISMLPMLRQGKDSVTLSAPPDRLKKYDLPLYQRDNGQYILHRVISAGETYICCGDNQFNLETGVRPDQIIAIVTSFTRNGKVHSVQEPEYLLYCSFWNGTRRFRCFSRHVIRWIIRHLQNICDRKGHTKIAKNQKGIRQFRVKP